MVEVGNKLIGQFADSVSQQLVGRKAGGAELVDVTIPEEVAAEVTGQEPDADIAVLSGGGRAPIGARRVPDAAPINLIESAGAPLLKRILPVALGVVALFLLRKLLKRNKSA